MRSSKAANAGAIGNLLRVARREFRADVAFAVLAANGSEPELFRIPGEDESGAPSDVDLFEVADRASLDPEFSGARAFVRTVQLASATILAVAPVPGAGAVGMVGVLGEDHGAFGTPQLTLLDGLADRIARHVHAMATLESATREGPPPPGAQTDLGRDGAFPGGTGASPETVAGPGEAGSAGAPLAAEPTQPDALQVERPVDPQPAVIEPEAEPVAEPVPEPAPEAAPQARRGGEAEGGTDPVTPGPRGPGFAAFGSEPAGPIAPSLRSSPEPPSWQVPPLLPTSGASGPRRLAGGRDATAPAPVWATQTASAASADTRAVEPPAPGSWWVTSDRVTGLPSLGQFFSRAGRLLGSDARATGAVALVLVEVPDERTAPAAARALAAQLRFSDPLARVDRDLFAAAVLLFPGSVRGDAVEERLGAAVRSALDWLAPVRTTHVLAEPGDRRDVDELLRQAMVGLPGRSVRLA